MRLKGSFSRGLEYNSHRSWESVLGLSGSKAYLHSNKHGSSKSPGHKTGVLIACRVLAMELGVGDPRAFRACPHHGVLNLEAQVRNLVRPLAPVLYKLNPEKAVLPL